MLAVCARGRIRGRGPAEQPGRKRRGCAGGCGRGR